MKKFFKALAIIPSTSLTIVGIYGFVPEHSALWCFFNKIINYVNSKEWIEIIISIVVLTLSLIVMIDVIHNFITEPKKHRLKKGSKKFYKFFSEWYSREGELTIICENTKWIRGNNNNNIFYALLDKAQKNQLYIFTSANSNNSSDTLAELKEHGATVKTISQKITAGYSLSCLSFMENNSSVIVRDKRNDKNKTITIDEVDDTYVTDLLNLLIEEKIQHGTKFQQ